MLLAYELKRMKSPALIPLLVIAFIAFIIFAGLVFACVVIWKLIQRGSTKPPPAPMEPLLPPTATPPPAPAQPPTLPAAPPHPPTPMPARTLFMAYAKILDNVMPDERGSKYEEPLWDLLERDQIGQIVGGGTMLNEDKSIAFVNIDLQLINLDTALQAVRLKLRELGAPPGSVLEYEANGEFRTLPIYEG
jgi:hypothetical protein